MLGTASGQIHPAQEKAAEPEGTGVPRGGLMSVPYPGCPQSSHLVIVGLGEACGVLSTAWSRNQIFRQNSFKK